MTKLGIATPDHRAAARKYLKDNRDSWKALGVRHITAGVPEPVRDTVLAEIEVHKFMHLANMADAKETDVNTLDEIARRNMAKFPTDEAVEAAYAQLENSNRQRDAEHFLDQYKYYKRKFAGVRSHYDPDMEYTSRKRIEAKGVSYTNLACAYFKLALVVLAAAGQQSVFGNHNTPLDGGLEEEV